MTPILLLIAGAAIFFWWNAARAAVERATQVGRNACAAANVIWLDQSVQATGVRLRRNDDGRMGLERSFRFDYSYDGVERYTGKLVMHGDRLVSFVGPTRPDNTADFRTLN